MSNIMSLASMVELRYEIGIVGGMVEYGFKNYLFANLKKGDVFRYKLSRQREMIIDTFGYELFTCKSDAKYDDLRKWSVEIE